jgi:hypothetical protein
MDRKDCDAFDNPKEGSEPIPSGGPPRLRSLRERQDGLRVPEGDQFYSPANNQDVLGLPLAALKYLRPLPTDLFPGKCYL